MRHPQKPKTEFATYLLSKRMATLTKNNLWPIGRSDFVMWLNEHMSPPIKMYLYAEFEIGNKTPSPAVQKRLYEVLDGPAYQALIG